MKTVALGEVAAINPRADTLAPHESVSFVGMAELDAETATARSREIKPFEEVSRGYTVFRDRDVLVAKITPCWENGKIGQAQLEHRIGVGSTEFHVIRPSSIVEERYLLHFLRQPAIRVSGELRMTGSSGQRRVPVAFLQELPMPLPPLDDQRRTAAILDQADALRAKRHQVLAHLDALTRSIFHDMFGQADASRRGVAKLDEIAIWRSGGTPPRSRGDYFDGDIPWFSSGELGPLFLAESKECVTPRAIAETSAKEVLPGSILVGMYDTAALKSSIATVRSACNQAVAFASPDASVANSVFVYFAIQSLRNRVLVLRRGIRQKNLNLSMVRDIAIPWASLDLQHEFAARVETINAQRAAVQRALTADNELFASLQARAFRGELR